MTSEQLRSWQESLELTTEAAAASLGMSLSGYYQLLAGRHRGTGKPQEVDRRTALACAALKKGLKPYGG